MALKKSRTFQGLGKSGGDDQAVVVHWGHPNHPLVELHVADMFSCAGCKEYGSGKRFACPHCDYQLHPFCAAAPATINHHPLHSRHMLILFSKPGSKGGSKCEVCQKACRGYAFRCNACSFQIHPCCATLAPNIRLPRLHPHPLSIQPETLSSGLGPGPSPCAECGTKRPGRVYRCTFCDYHVHAVCVKPALNGLRENGFKDPRPNRMLDGAARLASQVMSNFIGGLIEGIAEGFGQVIIQDALKGRSPSSQVITQDALKGRPPSSSSSSSTSVRTPGPTPATTSPGKRWSMNNKPASS